MLHKKSPHYSAAMKAAKAIKKSRTPIEKRLAVCRWRDAALRMLG